MRDAILKSGRDIFYSICNWGLEDTTEWGPKTGNSWRTTVDISDFWLSVERNFKLNDAHWNVSGPGGWNDPDMLEVGNGGLSYEQEKSHFALWAAAKSPLIIGCDLDKISNESFAIITNEELIAINQDPQGVQASCHVNCDFEDQLQVYASPLYNGDVAVVVINWAFFGQDKFTLNFADIGLDAAQEVSVRDLHNHKDLGSFIGSISFDAMKAYESFALRITPKKSQDFLN